MKRVTLVTDLETREVFAYATLTRFLDKHPEYNKDHLYHCIGRKKEAFIDERFKIEFAKIIR